MAAANYDEALRRLLISEGGYSNDAGDPGGPTKYGITIGDYRKYINPKGTANDVRNMTVDQAKTIYKERYARPLHFDELPSGVDYAVFDYGVNSGISRSAKVLQRLVGTPADGVIGPVTLAAAAKRDPKQLIEAISKERLAFLQGLSTWRIFGRGWGRRVAEVKAAALAMADKAPTPPIILTPPVPAEPKGKGHVTEPKVVVPTVTAAGGGVGAVLIAGWQWFSQHPVEIGIVVIGIVLLTVAIVMAVKQHFQTTFEQKQTALPADLQSLPEAKS